MEKQIIDITPTRTTFAVKQRVAAYARVSCDKDTMLHSLAAQIDYYRKYITRNPEWTFVGVYADEAKTGTKDDREQFQKLLSDCRSG
ncbi:MAG: recombinase family protein, partial [Bacteroidia bacterium]|nr:recombinase family protein [Bacteroidia bacterium]